MGSFQEISRNRHSALTDAHVLKALEVICDGNPVGKNHPPAPAHPFPARMPLTVALALVEMLSDPGDIILDPLAGSGTTLVAAKFLGRIGVGFDLDPLAVQLARAATMTVDLESLQRAQLRVLARATDFISHGSLSINWHPAALDGDESSFLGYWFPKRSRRELVALARAIGEERQSRVRTFLWSVFSSLIIAKSAGSSYALDLAHSRPHRDSEKLIRWPIEHWASQFKRAMERSLFKADQKDNSWAEAIQGDARKLPLRNSAVDMILTSPPYLQAIDYIRTHKFSLVWMGYPLSELREIRGRLIGAERGNHDRDLLPEPLELRLRRTIPNVARQARVRHYLTDLQTVLLECSRVLKPGGLAVLALGPCLISRRKFDAAQIVELLAAGIGLKPIGSIIRRLSEYRRALPPPRLVRRDNSLHKRMRGEVYLAVRKSSTSRERGHTR